MKKKKTKLPLKDRQATEDKLLCAAEKVFAKSGFRGATTRLIAEKAHINPSLINRYFDGKYGLLLTLLQKKGEEFHRNKLSYPACDTLQEELNQFGLVLLKSCLKEIAFFKIVITQLLTDPVFAKKYRDKLPPIIENAALLDRILKFDIDQKMANEIIHKVKNYVNSLIIIEYLLQGESEAVLEERLLDYIKDFSDIIHLRLKKIKN